jgi:hypothetical protein
MTSRSTRRVLSSVLVLLLVAAAAACGDDDDDSDTGANPTTSATSADGDDEAGDEGGDVASGIDPCSLLTVEEVESATGVSTEAEYDEMLSNDDQVICNWIATEGPMAGIQLRVIPEGPVADFDRQRQSADETSGPAIDVEVAGADRAFSAAEGSIIGMQVGGSFVQVSNLGHGGNEVILPLAELVAPRI